MDRCQPINLAQERVRVERAWQRGQPAQPRYEYAPRPDFTELRRHLERLAEVLEPGDPIERLCAARARELELEARAAEAVGQPEFRSRARERFTFPTDHHHRQAEIWARDWTESAPPPARGRLLPSDDERDPASLVSSLRRSVSRLGLPYRILLRANLTSAAVTDEGVILVRTGAAYTQEQVGAIVTHEIEGHALPRQRAHAQELVLVRTGTAGAADDEEGRALVLEERRGLFGRARRAELGWRHLAALALYQGADFGEIVELLRGRGAPLDVALALGLRSVRGGGLGREIVYLPARSRMLSALEREPHLEDWLEHGRASWQAARVLFAVWGPPRIERPTEPSARADDSRWASYP